MARAATDLSTLDGLSDSGPIDGLGVTAVAMLTILGHPDTGRIGERAGLFDLAAGGQALLSRIEPRFAVPGAKLGEHLGDAHLSRRAVRILRLGDGRIRLDKRDSPMRVVVQGVPIETSRDFSATALCEGLVIELANRVVMLLHEAESSTGADAETDPLGLVGDSDAMKRLRHEITRLSNLDVSVLIMGETGSGKELVARAIHRSGARCELPFIAVNMGAIPPSLAGAELFGSEPGAFTGAVRNAGHFRAAGDGTLFLDEVGETPLDVQAMLLRALDMSEVQPLGSSRPLPVHARVIAATDADLEQRVDAGGFKAPLFHRLASYRLLVPPLRERRDDIGRLLMHFLAVELERLGDADRLQTGEPLLSAELCSALCRYDWPGNVRQLRNVVRQLVLGTPKGRALEAGAILEHLLTAPAEPAAARNADSGADSGADGEADGEADQTRARAEWRKPSEVSEVELLEALKECRWDLKSTAGRLRVSRTSLYALVRSSRRIRPLQDIPAEEIVRCYADCGGDLERMVDRLEVSKHALQRKLRELRVG